MIPETSPDLHPHPTSEGLGFLCLQAILLDPLFSERVRRQAVELQRLTVLGYLLPAEEHPPLPPGKVSSAAPLPSSRR